MLSPPTKLLLSFAASSFAFQAGIELSTNRDLIDFSNPIELRDFVCDSAFAASSFGSLAMLGAVITETLYRHSHVRCAWIGAWMIPLLPFCALQASKFTFTGRSTANHVSKKLVSFLKHGEKHISHIGKKPQQVLQILPPQEGKKDREGYRLFPQQDKVRNSTKILQQSSTCNDRGQRHPENIGGRVNPTSGVRRISSCHIPKQGEINARCSRSDNIKH